MKKLVAFLLLAPLAACGSDQPAEPTPEATVASPAPEPTPSLPTPDKTTFAGVYAEACHHAAKVSTSFCRSEGFGKQSFICDYTLGDSKRKHNAKLMPGDGEWTLADPEKTCAADAA